MAAATTRARARSRDASAAAGASSVARTTATWLDSLAELLLSRERVEARRGVRAAAAASGGWRSGNGEVGGGLSRGPLRGSSLASLPSPPPSRRFRRRRLAPDPRRHAPRQPRERLPIGEPLSS